MKMIPEDGEELESRGCEDRDISQDHIVFDNTHPFNKHIAYLDLDIRENLFLEFAKRSPKSKVENIYLAIRIKNNYEDSFTDKNYIKIGISARNAKVFSSPMQEIVKRLLYHKFFQFIIITDDIIDNVDVKHWPVVDTFLAFYSKGYDLDKAIAYSNLRRPFLINDLEMQYVLQDRLKIYQVLKEANIEIPRYAAINRLEKCEDPIDVTVEDIEDGLSIDNKLFYRPFVEKPVSADDHDICIYYPQEMGGGCQKLFRKIGNTSSIFCAAASYRTSGSYIYEEFLTTDGVDVKVYSVGKDYAHAEARKSPSLDGVVLRDAEGKEVRYPVLLSAYEKLIASKICRIFKQNVCGFDILRTKGISYICDVNGFSFVKKSRKYYNDCAIVLGDIIIRNAPPHVNIPRNFSILSLKVGSLPRALLSSKQELKNQRSELELRCVIGIFRHGDRTPKQKMKMVVQHQLFIDLFRSCGGDEEGSIKMKSPKQLSDILIITRELLKERDSDTLVENPAKLLQMKFVLEMYENFSGINRKIQLKSLTDERNAILHYKFKGHRHHDVIPQNTPTLLLILKWGGEITKAGLKHSEALGTAYRNLYPRASNKFFQETKVCSASSKLAQLGGKQEYIINSEGLDYSIDDAPFNDDNQTTSMNDIGILRLHSTYRHNLKIYSSDEGRVQSTAAAFTKGFLNLSSKFPSVLIHFVNSDKEATKMLDSADSAEFMLQTVKTRLHDMLKVERPLTENDLNDLCADDHLALKETLEQIKNPNEACKTLYDRICKLTAEIRKLQQVSLDNEYQSKLKENLCFSSHEGVLSSEKSDSNTQLYHKETFYLLERRWAKIEKDFTQNDGSFNISLIPDIYDCSKYDFLHNEHLGINDSIVKIYVLSKLLASVVMPLEYGITSQEKKDIGRKITSRLLRKINCDLSFAINANETTYSLNTDEQYETGVSSPNRHVRTRLYFTSESHIYGIMNTFLHGGLFNIKDKQWEKACEKLSKVSEFNFLSQIVIMQYEDPLADPDSDNRYHVEIKFSPGNKLKLPPNLKQQDVISYKPEKNICIKERRNSAIRISNTGKFSGSSGNEEVFDILSKNKQENGSDSDFYHLRKEAFDITKAYYSLRKPLTRNNSLECDIEFIPEVEPLFALNGAVSQKEMTNFLDRIIKD